MLKIIDPIKGIAHRYVNGKTYVITFDVHSGRILSAI